MIAIPQGGIQPLHYAAMAGQMEMLRLLVDVYGVSPEATAEVRTELEIPARLALQSQNNHFHMTCYLRTTGW